MNRNLKFSILGGIILIIVLIVGYRMFSATEAVPGQPTTTTTPETPPGSTPAPTNPTGSSPAPQDPSGSSPQANNTESNLPSEQTNIIFWEGNGCDQDMAGSYKSSMKGKIHKNDEARSLKLIDVPAGTFIAIYDNPDGRENDDFATIKVKKRIFDECIHSFEESRFNDYYQMQYNRRNGLDGKVSYIQITYPE